METKHLNIGEPEFDYERSWMRKIAEVDSKESGRIQQTLALIPPDVRTVLDAGCGDGRVTAGLDQRCRVIGVDVSSTALRRRMDHARVAGHLTDLPFSDAAVDLVLASEVIEHIPVVTLPKVFAEIYRVSRRYILITVPYRETLADAVVRCSCGFVFHKWGHIQSFDENKVRSIYPRARLLKLAYIGAPKPNDPPLLKTLRQRWAGRYAAADPDTLCPKCGGREFVTGSRNLISMLLGGATLVASRTLSPRKATWIGGLFEKVDVPSSSSPSR